MRVATICLALGVLAHPAAAGAGGASSRFEGTYWTGGMSDVTVRHVQGDRYVLEGDTWKGEGRLVGGVYHGRFHGIDRSPQHASPPLDGTHRIVPQADGSLKVYIHYANEPNYRAPMVWKPSRLAPPVQDRVPQQDEYVYVEKLPTVKDKIQPVYPAEAREKNIEGTVMVMALVGRDGRVRDTHVIKSIPELDDAARAAVRRWRFAPATNGRDSVAVWVGVPVRFALR